MAKAAATAAAAAAVEEEKELKWQETFQATAVAGMEASPQEGAAAAAAKAEKE